MTGWYRRYLSETSLRTKVTIGIVLPMLLFLSIYTYAEYIRQRQLLLSNLSVFASYSAQVIEDNLVHQMLATDFKGIQEMLDTIGSREEFKAVYILDSHGEIIFSPNGENLGTRLDNKSVDCQPCHSLPADERANNVIVENKAGERVFRSMHPLENSPACSECHDPGERLIGLLLTDISVAPAIASLERDLFNKLALWGLSVLVTIGVVNLVLDRTVFLRLNRLTSAISSFGQGKPTAAVSDEGSDEIARLTSAFDDMARKIEKRRIENEHLSEKLQLQNLKRGELLRGLITAQENERKRIAREIHDELGQSLSALALQIEGLRRLMEKDQDRAAEQLSKIQPLITSTTSEMYDIILDLRPSSLDDLGLVPTLQTFLNRLVAENGLKYELDTDKLPDRLPPEIETALFRIIQEAVNNAVRHARPSRVKVSLARYDHTVEGEVDDNGEGFDLNTIDFDGSSPRGLGLLGMQERAYQCGGQLLIHSNPGHGTRINVRIPLPEDDYE